MLGDADADGQSVLVAASSWLAAVVTPPSAVTTPDTVLTLGLAARADVAVWSLSSAAFRSVDWGCHWPLTRHPQVTRG